MSRNEIGVIVTLSASLVLYSIFFTLFFATPFGSLISTDSVYYLSAGKSFAVGNGFTAFNNEPITLWPPLFPFLIGTIAFIGLDPVAVIPTIQGFTLGATAALGFFASYVFSRSWILSSLCGLLIVTAMPLIVLANRFLAEPIYIFLVSAVVIITISYLKRPDYKILLLLGGTCALAALQRYAGFSLIVAVCLCLLLYDHRPFIEKTKRMIVFGLVSCTPLAIWIIRNMIITGSLSGSRSFSIDLFVPALSSATQTFGGWFTPMLFGDPFTILIGATMASSAVLIMLLSIWKRGNLIAIEVSVFAAFIVVGFVFAVYASFTACCTDRFLAPLFPVVILFLATLAVMIARRLASYSEKGNRFIVGATIIVFCCVLGLQISRASIYINDLFADIHGFNTPAWTNKSIIQQIVKYPFEEDACIFSNDAPAVAYFLSRYCVKRGPRRARYYPASVRLDERDKVFASIARINAKVYFIWFDGVSEERFFPVSVLRDKFMVKSVYDTSDGTIYEITERNPRN